MERKGRGVAREGGRGGEKAEVQSMQEVVLGNDFFLDKILKHS